MRKLFHLISLTFITLSLNPSLVKTQTNKYLSTQFNNPIIKSEFLLYLTKNYSTNAFSILNKRKFDFYTKWALGKSHNEILGCYAVVIHETCHSINSDIGGFFSYGYYISPNIEIKVSKSDIFKSNEFDKDIPESWKSNIFRYKTYIQGVKGDKEVASIYDGIYGLMDEFDAYYQSTKAVVELYDYYKTLANYSNPTYWSLYISNCYSSIYAYHEFRLFIAWYIKFARKNYPSIYQSIMDNKKLKAVFTLIDIGYEKVVQQYFENRKNIVENINQAGKKKAKITDKYFVIKTAGKKGSTSIGFGIPDAEISYLNAILTLDDYLILKSITIEGMNELNYKKFLD